MSIYSVFFSPTGGTSKVNSILTGVYDDVKVIDLIENNEYRENFCENDIVYIAVPSFGGRVPGYAADVISKLHGGNALAVIVCVYGNRAYEDTLIELKNIVKEAGFKTAAAVSAIAEHSIMHRFAKGRPDNDDVKQLEEFARKIKSVLTYGNYHDVQVPGNIPYKEFKGIPMIPSSNSKCTKCGICAAKCPVHAIPIESPEKTDKDKCISCMHCISVCPENARSLNKLMVEAASLKMHKLFEERKENELFI